MTEHEIGLNQEGRARRRFLKQAGAVAWASPFIVTMMSRAAHAQEVCGTQDLEGLCNLVGLPCGTTAVCAPVGTIPDPGGDCVCTPA